MEQLRMEKGRGMLGGIWSGCGSTATDAMLIAATDVVLMSGLDAGTYLVAVKTVIGAGVGNICLVVALGAE